LTDFLKSLVDSSTLLDKSPVDSDNHLKSSMPGKHSKPWWIPTNISKVQWILAKLS